MTDAQIQRFRAIAAAMSAGKPTVAEACDNIIRFHRQGGFMKKDKPTLEGVVPSIPEGEMTTPVPAEEPLTKEQQNIERIIAMFAGRQAEASVVFKERLRSRGSDNITEQGIGGVILRMQHDKMARLKKVARAALLKQSDPDFDTEAYFQVNYIQMVDVIDDLIDISNYSIIAVMLLDGQW
jgi:hypothetical protein